MKILVWCPHLNMGGGGRLLSQLAPALAQQAEVDLVKLAVPAEAMEAGDLDSLKRAPISFFGLTPEKKMGTVYRWLKTEGQVLGVRGTGRVKMALRNRLIEDPTVESLKWEAEQLRQAARDCDVVYAFWPQLQRFHQIDKPLVCSPQDTTNLDFPEILGWKQTRDEYARAAQWLSGAQRIIVSSQCTKNNLVRLFGDHCKSAVVIPHAILPSDANPTVSLDLSLLRKLPERYIVFPGNITAHKNHYTLLAAWARFLGRKQYPLVLFGSDTEILNETSPPLDSQAARVVGLIRRKQLQQDEDFYALGYLADAYVLPLIERATALIMPSLAEGGGSYPVEEALSLGVPVLCSDIPVMREHLAGRSAKIGWFDPESPESILRAINDLFDNYDDYKRTALNAIRDPRYTWEDIAAQYVGVFQSAIDQARNPV
jgi:glycosyltransferase involved in cell wall biosynthesis